jgi:3-dehydroquinate synthase
MVLNFGHTFGHCLEKEFNFRKYGHGESVMYGILIALSLSTVIVGLEKRVYTDYLHWMKSQKWFDQEVYLHQEWFTNGLTQDKKIRGNLLKIILIKGYGKPCIHSIEESELIALLERSFYEINQDLI